MNNVSCERSERSERGERGEERGERGEKGERVGCERRLIVVCIEPLISLITRINTTTLHYITIQYNTTITNKQT